MPTGIYERKERTTICQRCGAEFTTKNNRTKWCPECARIVRYEQSERCRRSHKAAAAVTSVDLAGRTHGMSAADVPDIPADDYYSEADRIKKTAPIETVLVQKKEDKEMDMSRFPSGSNRLEHPEYFTGDTPESLGQTTTVHDDNDSVPDAAATGKDMPDISASDVGKMRSELLDGFRKDRKAVILSLYSTICDICRDADVAVTEVLGKLVKVDEALS